MTNRVFARLAAAWIIAATAQVSHAGTRYHVIALGPADRGLTSAVALNGSGVVVMTPDSMTYPQGVILDHGSATQIGELGSMGSFAFDIDAGGSVVGVSTSAQDGNGHPFLYRDGVMTDLGLPPGAYYAEARAINGKGAILLRAPGSPDKVYIRVPSGKLKELELPNGAYGLFGTAINDKRQVTGQIDGPDGEHAFLYTDGVVHDLGSLQGAHAGTSFGLAINSKGQLVGYSSTADAVSHGFLYSNGMMKDLGTVLSKNGSYSEARGINNHGQIVGASVNASGSLVGVVWDGKATHDLNALLDETSVGWVIATADDINDAGQITGRAFQPDGPWVIYLATPVK